MFWRQLVWLIWGLIKGSFFAIGKEVTKDLIALAQRFVAEAALNPGMTGAQKREWVAEQLRNHAIQTGNQVADSVINLVIEIALQGNKNKAT